MNTTVHINAGVAGKFKIEAHSIDSSGNEVSGSRRLCADWFDNLVTDVGLDAMALPRFIQFCQVGSGSTAPAVTDTTLASLVAGVSGSFANGTGGAGFTSIVGTYVFPKGAAAGNLSEIGAANSDSGQVTSRALILDGVGSPTTITVTSIEVLTVTYEFRLYYSQLDSLSTITVGGVSIDTVTRASAPGDYGLLTAQNSYGFNSEEGFYQLNFLSAGQLNAPGSSPGGTVFDSIYLDSSGISTYVSGSHYFDVTWQVEPSQANGDIGIVADHASGQPPLFLKTSFTPPITKNNTQTLSLTIRRTWGRYVP